VTRKRDQNLRLELHQVKEELRQSLAQRVVDLKVASGLLQEKDRGSALKEMRNPRKFPFESLDDLRRALLTLIVQRNHQTLQTENTNPPTQSDYIQ
jgi:hypothetical protein